TRTKKDSDTLSIAVSGLSYQTLQSAARPSTVEVSVEQRRDHAEPKDAGELAWEQVAASTKQLTPSAGPAGTTIWTGQITLPKGDHFRVIISEFERFGPTAADRRLV